MGQCRTLDADVPIGSHYSDYSSCAMSLFEQFFFAHTCLPP